MGHAGALIGSHADSHEAKVRALRAAGVATAAELSALIPDVQRVLGE
jgi:succinyl-CoA synthetase alpha subunit